MDGHGMGREELSLGSVRYGMGRHGVDGMG